MAIYHFDVSTVSRSNGRSSIRTAAYITGTRLVDERTGRVANYQRKVAEVLTTGTVGPVDWQATEQAEKRKDSRVGRSIILALPFELGLRKLRALVIRFARWLRQTWGMALQWAIHGPPGDKRNVHAHVLMTTRVVSADGTHGKKLRDLDRPVTSRGILRNWRQQWQDRVNRALEASGLSERVDGRSHADAGRDCTAALHLGPMASAQAKKGFRVWATRHNTAVKFVEEAKRELEKVTHQIRTARVNVRRSRVQKQCGKARKRFRWAKRAHDRATATEHPYVTPQADQGFSLPVTSKTSSRRRR